MPELPRATGAEVAKVLCSLGFVHDRTRGSHHVFKKAGMASVSVPFNGNKPLRVGTLRAIIRQSGASRDEFIRALSS